MNKEKKMKRQILLITLLTTFFLIGGCSIPKETKTEEIVENRAEEKQRYQEESYEISLDQLLTELSEIVDEKDFETIKIIIKKIEKPLESQ